jgi:hypothetical protein
MRNALQEMGVWEGNGWAWNGQVELLLQGTQRCAAAPLKEASSAGPPSRPF